MRLEINPSGSNPRHVTWSGVPSDLDQLSGEGTTIRLPGTTSSSGRITQPFSLDLYVVKSLNVHRAHSTIPQGQAR